MDWVSKQITPLFQGIREFTGEDKAVTATACANFCVVYRGRVIEEIDRWINSEGYKAENRLAGFEEMLDNWYEGRDKITIDNNCQFSIIDRGERNGNQRA